MSRDVTCPWCHIVCSDGAEMERHIDQYECSVKKLRDVIDRMEDEAADQDEAEKRDGHLKQWDAISRDVVDDTHEENGA